MVEGDDPDLGERVALGHWPTPLEPCHRLRDRLGGPLVWLKRDDCSGLALGGNKTRKLEFLLGEARKREATGVVTFGALQSNHARQTAAACARIGVPCDLILTDTVERATPAYRASGNRLLDDILGATVHIVPDDSAALERAAELAAADPDRYVIDPGGSSAVGSCGYVAAARELTDQLTPLGLAPSHLVTAASTGGTAAGLAVGLARVQAPMVVLAAAVYKPAAPTRAAIDRVVDATAARLGVEPPRPDRLVVDDAEIGAGYGIETPASHAAVELLARVEGVLLDPVYTAKAFALLLDSLADLDPDGDVVFLHTGGQAGLFAYGDAFA